MNRLSVVRLLAVMASVLSPSALAHGEAASVNLRGAVLCLDPTSVQLRFGGMSAAQQRQLSGVKTDLNSSLVSAFKVARVRYQTQSSCQKSPAFTRAVVEVRYLNPQNYVGFGDPAYSYTLSLQVGSPGRAPQPPSGKNTGIQFASSWSDIHSEGHTKKPLAGVLTTLGQTQARELAHAWQHDNP